MNFLISVIAWAIWNIAEMEITRRTLDEDGNPQTNFTWADYTKSHRFTWIGSFLSIFILLWFGYKQMNLDPFEVITGSKLGWHDAYYLFSGFLWDAVIFAFVFSKKYFKKKTEQL